MSHQEKQEIFDRYAEAKGYDNFIEIISDYITLKSPSDIIQHAFAACDLVQEEQQKRIAENACIEPKGMMTRVDQSSILNPENKIQ